jgi:hypothetical protein
VSWPEGRVDFGATPLSRAAQDSAGAVRPGSISADVSDGEHVEEAADCLRRFERVAHRSVGMHAVLVPSAHPLAIEVPARYEVGHDALRRPLRDSDPSGDVSQPDVGLGGHAQQHVRVVGQERPPPGRFARHRPTLYVP